ncbi:MAG TPA: LysR family transcriptional regulator, partial [Devosia sp.]|nr:LysR family transcriptional regulator [Devosia sp.]
MNWDDVRIFLAVARQGQILGAAKSLGLNHATVARRLTALEQALGARLFVRKTNGSDLSSAGEKFLVHAERIESEMLAARGATDADSRIAGTVRVGAPDGFGVAFLAPRIGELAERHKGLRIELVPVPRAFSLSRREADIAVTVERPREGRLVARKLTDYRLGLFAARSYLDQYGTPASLDALSGHR